MKRKLVVDEGFHRGPVDGRLGQPDSLGIPSETAPEVAAHSPDELAAPILEVGQGHDHVVIGLGEGVAVTAPTRSPNAGPRRRWPRGRGDGAPRAS